MVRGHIISSISTNNHAQTSDPARPPDECSAPSVRWVIPVGQSRTFGHISCSTAPTTVWGCAWRYFKINSLTRRFTLGQWIVLRIYDERDAALGEVFISAVM